MEQINLIKLYDWFTGNKATRLGGFEEYERATTNCLGNKKL